MERSGARPVSLSPQGTRAQLTSAGIDPSAARATRREETWTSRKQLRLNQALGNRRAALADLWTAQGKANASPPTLHRLAEEQDANSVRRGSHEGAMQDNAIEVSRLASQLHAEDSAVLLNAVTELRSLLAVAGGSGARSALYAVNAGVVPPLVHFLRCHDMHALQAEAAWSLSCISAATTQCVAAIVQAEGVASLLLLVDTPTIVLREHAIRTLGNIAGDSRPNRDLVLQSGFLPRLVILITETVESNLDLLRLSVWALANLMHGSPPFEWTKPALPIIAQLLYSTDDEIAANACQCVASLTSNTPKSQVESVIKMGVCRRMVELLMLPSSSVVLPAVRSIANFAVHFPRALINCNALPCVLAVLQSPKKLLREEAMRALVHLTDNDKANLQAAIEAGIVQPVIALLQLPAQYSTLILNALAFLSNALRVGDRNQIAYLLGTCDCLSGICRCLSMQDPAILTLALDTLVALSRRLPTEGQFNVREMLHSNGVKELLGALTMRHPERIHTAAVQLLGEVFAEGSEADGKRIVP